MRIGLPLASLVLAAAVPAGATLADGARAPDFTTQAAIAGKVYRLHLADQLKKGPVVLYFFPAAFTGGCNAEAHAFAEMVPQFRAAGATVIGMSSDPVDVLAQFSTQKCAGKFAVATAAPSVIQAYDVALGHKMAGRDITSRTSYVIAPDGKVVFVHSDMSPAEHVTLTLAAVKKLHGG